MIFRILKVRKTMKELKEDPSKLAGEEAGGFFMGMILGPALIPLLVLIFLFVLGFTGFIGGPYGLFKFLFFLFLIPSIGVFLILFKAYKIIKGGAKKVVDNTLKVESKVVE